MSFREPRPASHSNRGPLSSQAPTTATLGAHQGRKQPTPGKPCHAVQAGLCHQPAGSARGSMSPLLASEPSRSYSKHGLTPERPHSPHFPANPRDFPMGPRTRALCGCPTSNKLCKSPVARFGFSSLAHRGQAAHGLGAGHSMGNEGTGCGGGEPQEAWHAEEAPCTQSRGLSATTPGGDFGQGPGQGEPTQGAQREGLGRSKGPAPAPKPRHS